MLLVLCGPTGTGKSEVAVELAQLVDGEVVSADSMMVYRGLDLGTAKPTLAQRGGVPHHLIDVVEPTEDYHVARYQREARAAIDDVLARSKTPLLVGGTGYYIRAVIDEVVFTDTAPAAPDLRAELMEQARIAGPESVHARLAELDPASAARIHPNNLKRVVRALEIVLQTGAPVPPNRIPGESGSRHTLRILGLTRERTLLYRRLDERIDAMLAAGFVDEVRGLRARGVGRQHTSQQALGYRHLHATLEGECDFAEAVRTWKRDTRHYARRQWTWFRGDARVEWLDVDAFASRRALAEELAARIRQANASD